MIRGQSYNMPITVLEAYESVIIRPELGVEIIIHNIYATAAFKLERTSLNKSLLIYGINEPEKTKSVYFHISNSDYLTIINDSPVQIKVTADGMCTLSSEPEPIPSAESSGALISLISYHNLYLPGNETTAQLIPGGGVITKVNLNQIKISSEMSNPGDKSIITIPKDGLYEIRTSIGLPSIGASTFTTAFSVNNAIVDRFDFAFSSPTSNVGFVVFPPVQLSIGDIIELHAAHWGGDGKYLYGYDLSTNSICVKLVG